MRVVVWCVCRCVRGCVRVGVCVSTGLGLEVLGLGCFWGAVVWGCVRVRSAVLGLEAENGFADSMWFGMGLKNAGRFAEKQST